MVCLTNCIMKVQRATSTTGLWMTRETTGLSPDCPRCPVFRRMVIPRGWEQLDPELPASCHSSIPEQLHSCLWMEDKVDSTVNMVLLMGHCPTGEIYLAFYDIRLHGCKIPRIWDLSGLLCLTNFVCSNIKIVLRLKIHSIWRHDAPILNDKYFPKAAYGSMANMVEEDVETGLFKYPHLQLRNVSYSVRKGRREERILDMINIEARGGELVALLATSSKFPHYLIADILWYDVRFWYVSMNKENFELWKINVLNNSSSHITINLKSLSFIWWYLTHPFSIVWKFYFIADGERTITSGNRVIFVLHIQFNH